MSAENRWEKMKDEDVGKYSIRFVDNRIPAKTGYVISVIDREGEKMGQVTATFKSVARGNMTKENFDLFTSDKYKYAIGDHLKLRGLHSVAAEMHGTWESDTGYTGSLGNVLEGTRKNDPYRTRKKAGKPKGHKPGCDCNFCGKGKKKKEDKEEKESRHAAEKVKDRKLQQDYYADLYGDPDFARLLVSKNRKLRNKIAELEGNLEATGGDRELKARVKRAYEVAVEEAELGIIDDTDEIITDRTEEIAVMIDDDFEDALANIEAWKREGQIGDTLVDVEEGEGPGVEAGIESDVLPSVAERGETDDIVVDPAEQAVRDPSEVIMRRDLGGESAYHSGGFGQVRGNVEGLDDSRSKVSDNMRSQLRTVARSGGVVPQMTKHASDLSGTSNPLDNLSERFTNTAKRIEQAGVRFNNPATRHNR